MLFNSIEFLVFLPIVFILYWFVFKPLRFQNLLVLIVSYIFYGWWNWRFLLLIALTSLCSFASGIIIEKKQGHRFFQRSISAANIILNLCILGVFKYFNFFRDNLEILLQSFGIQLDWPTLNVILPVGISFYTFQALSYSIDVYRGNIKATRDIVAFFAFISFFPQLVAGPIERATNLLPQFLKGRTFNYEKAVDGCRQMLWGFFKKMVVADNCAVIVDQYWGMYDQQSGIQLLVVGVLFTFQIYCDFSGYSDIAIGSARLFGIDLMRNFNFPYFSRSIPEFWRRWHISLTTWFRDYIYFPLGGSRCAKWKVIRNTIIVFFVSGLWHGANWTFICWGLYLAILFMPYLIFGIKTKYRSEVAEGRWFPNAKEFFQIFSTFFLSVIGWIIFRAESMPQAIAYIGQIFSTSLFKTGLIDGKSELLLCLILYIAEWLQRDKQHALQLEGIPFMRFRAVRLVTYYAILIAIITLAGESEAFIYFQF